MHEQSAPAATFSSSSSAPSDTPYLCAGKGLNVYRYSSKYGANVDGYSPIYTPDIWSEGGNEYKLGSKGLVAWAGLLVILLGVGINLIISTSSL